MCCTDPAPGNGIRLWRFNVADAASVDSCVVQVHQREDEVLVVRFGERLYANDGSVDGCLRQGQVSCDQLCPRG